MQDSEAYLRQHERRNFLVNVVGEGVFFRVGITLTSFQTVLTALLDNLGASTVVIGLLPGLFVFMWTFPQGFAAFLIRGQARGRTWLTWLRVASGVPWVVMALYLGLSGAANHTVAIVTLLVVLTAFSIAGGASVPLWAGLIARLFRPTHRGRFYGWRSLAGAIAGFAAALAITKLLGELTFPQGYAWCFAVAGLTLALGGVAISLSREPAERRLEGPLDSPRPLRQFVHVFKTNRDFAAMSIIVALTAFGGGAMLGGMTAPFYMKYARDTFESAFHPGYSAEAYVGYATAATVVGHVLASLLTGRLTDRHSARIAFFTCIVLGALMPLVALAARGPSMFLLTFVLAGGAAGTTNTTYHNLVMSFAPPEHRGAYVGIMNTWRSTFFLAGPLFGGWLIQMTKSYEPLFILAEVVSIATAILFLRAIGLKRAESEGVVAGRR